jgi:hypothetical protein
MRSFRYVLFLTVQTGAYWTKLRPGSLNISESWAKVSGYCWSADPGGRFFSLACIVSGQLANIFCRQIVLARFGRATILILMSTNPYKCPEDFHYTAN